MTTVMEPDYWEEPDDDKSRRWEREDDDDQREQDERDRLRERGE